MWEDGERGRIDRRGVSGRWCVQVVGGWPRVWDGERGRAGRNGRVGEAEGGSTTAPRGGGGPGRASLVAVPRHLAPGGFRVRGTNSSDAENGQTKTSSWDRLANSP